MPTQELYRSIIVLAQDIKQRTSQKSDSQDVAPYKQTETTDIELPVLNISPRLPLLQSLLSKGVPHFTSQKLTDRLQRSLISLRRHFENELRQTWARIVDAPRIESMISLTKLRNQLESTYRILYDKKAEEWECEVSRIAVTRLQQLQGQLPVEGSQKPMFNQVCTLT